MEVCDYMSALLGGDVFACLYVSLCVSLCDRVIGVVVWLCDTNILW